MHHSYSPANLHGVEVMRLEPGTFAWMFSRYAGAPELVVGLDTQDESSYAYATLTGGKAFQVRFGRLPIHGAGFALPLHNAPVNISIPADAVISADSHAIGTLTVRPEGAYIAMKDMSSGYDDTCYVSLNDWTIHDHMPTNPISYMPFDSWKITTDHPTPSERKVLFEQGRIGKP